ncbi:MAG: hypothetical protein JJT95_14715 [Pararhodobacter sp.]|nr:hypothetical protein [Pararhodobacter sp.]
MSAPKTNLDKQKRRHWGPLTGIAVSLAVVAALFFGYLYYLADTETEQPVETLPETESEMPAEGMPATPLEPEMENQIQEVVPTPQD